MNSKIYTLFIAIALFACDTKEEKANAEVEKVAEPEAKAPKSPKTAAMANIGSAHIHIEYSSPSVRSRVIWGGLVPYGVVWSTGAHAATSINIPENVNINGMLVEKGKYAIFTIPGEKIWTVIINRNWEQHLADEYSMDDDVIRFEVVPEMLELNQEALTYEVKSNSDKTGTISIAWEKIKVTFDIEVN